MTNAYNWWQGGLGVGQKTPKTCLHNTWMFPKGNHFLWIEWIIVPKFYFWSKFIFCAVYWFSCIVLFSRDFNCWTIIFSKIVPNFWRTDSHWIRKMKEFPSKLILNHLIWLSASTLLKILIVDKPNLYWPNISISGEQLKSVHNQNNFCIWRFKNNILQLFLISYLL